MFIPGLTHGYISSVFLSSLWKGSCLIFWQGMPSLWDLECQCLAQCLPFWHLGQSPGPGPESSIAEASFPCLTAAAASVLLDPARTLRLFLLYPKAFYITLFLHLQNQP